MYEELALAFTLRVQVGSAPMIVVRAFDGATDSTGRNRIDVEVRQAGKVIFPRGQLYCALWASTDGKEARELVLALVGMRLGDTDRDYFDGYSEAQIDWARQYGESIAFEASYRYGNPG